MKFFQEVTQWADPNVPNHTYLLNDSKSKMIAYVKVGSREVFTFKNPIRIDLRGRKFREVPNTFGYKIAKEKPLFPQWKVQGSRGETYIVEKTDQGLTCTCQGFKFRGDCKHVKTLGQ